MSKGYTFNGGVLNSLNELGVCYSEHFAEGLEDVYNNTKSLIRFIRSRNKKLSNDIVSIMTSCKYQNNVLTFIIFYLCEDKRVVINGEALTLQNFIDTLKKYGKDHKAIFAFMEDLGISRTYATLNIEPGLSTDAYFIENNIGDSFAYEYLTSYYEFDYVESLQSFISNVFIYDEERFRRSIKVFRNDRFQLLLAHKVGFKEVYRMRSQAMPVFDAIKLLRGEFEEKDLIRLISDTFFWWLLDNFDKYTYKKEAKGIFKELKKIKNEKLKLDKAWDFISYVDMAARLYEIYIKFVEYSKKELIGVKKKLDVEQYTLDKAYCQTFICIDYMKDNTVKLPKEGLEQTNLEQEEANEEEQQLDDSEEEKVFEAPSNGISDQTLKKQEKLTFKLKRFSGFAIFFTVFFLAIVGAIKLLEVLGPEGLQVPQNIIDIPYLFIFLGCVVCNIIGNIVLRVRVSKTQQALDSIIYIQNVGNSNLPLNPNQKRKIQLLKEKQDLYRKKAMRSHRILTCILSILLCFISCVAAIFMVSLLVNKVNIPISWDEAYINNSLKFIYFLVGPAVGLVYGLIRKRKGAWTAILLVIASLASVVLLAVVL